MVLKYSVFMITCPIRSTIFLQAELGLASLSENLSSALYLTVIPRRFFEVWREPAVSTVWLSYLPKPSVSSSDDFATAHWLSAGTCFPLKPGRGRTSHWQISQRFSTSAYVQCLMPC